MSVYIKKQKTYFILAVIGMIILFISSINFLYTNNISFLMRPLISALHRVEYNGGPTSILSAAVINGTSNDLNFSDQELLSETRSIPVLVYHGITSKADRFSMTRETFKDQMFALKRAGYKTVSLEEFEDFMKGEKALPAKSFLLTFDDGRTDSYEEADPILMALDFSAVMFVATNSSFPESEDGRLSTYYISDQDIKKMIESRRWDIGSHAVQMTGGYVPISSEGTKQNFLSNRMWIENENRLETDEEYRVRIASELINSKTSLEQMFGIRVNTFSYPFGDYGQQSANNRGLATSTIENLMKDNYDFAFKQIWPNDGEFSTNFPGQQTNMYQLKRFETPTDWSGQELVKYLESINDKNILFSDRFEGNRGWKRTWGELEIKNGFLDLKSNESTTGAMTFLDGTRHWDNYIFMNTFEWLKGSHVSLLARYEDDQNYYSCTYNDEFVKIERYEKGNIKKLVEIENFVQIPKSDEVSLGVLVKDDFMQCMIGSTVVAYTTIHPGEGGIGVKIWDQDMNNAEIHMLEVLTDFSFNVDSVLSKFTKYSKIDE